MAKEINAGFHPQQYADNVEVRGYQPLTEGYKPQGGNQMPSEIPLLSSVIVPANSNGGQTGTGTQSQAAPTATQQGGRS